MLNSVIEYDSVNNIFASFVTPTIVCVFPNLGSYQNECMGSFNYSKRFIATTINRHPTLRAQQALKVENNDP